jgi:hypothetical protein
VGICIAPTQRYWAALRPERRMCHLGNTADRQPQWALTHCYLLQSTASQNEKLTRCHHWNLKANFSMLAHLPDRSAKSHPQYIQKVNVAKQCSQKVKLSQKYSQKVKVSYEKVRQSKCPNKGGGLA